MINASRPTWLSFLLLALMFITTLVISAQISRVVPITVSQISVNQVNDSLISVNGLSRFDSTANETITLNSDCSPSQHQLQNQPSHHCCGSVCLFKAPTYQSSAELAAQSHSLALIEPDQSITTEYRANTLYRPPIYSFSA